MSPVRNSERCRARSDKKKVAIKCHPVVGTSGIPATARAPAQTEKQATADSAEKAEAARQKRVEKMAKDAANSAANVTGIAQKIVYGAVHTAWKGELEFCNDGTFRRRGKDGGKWWCERWEGGGQKGTLVLAWSAWPRERMTTVRTQKPSSEIAARVCLERCFSPTGEWRQGVQLWRADEVEGPRGALQIRALTPR